MKVKRQTKIMTWLMVLGCSIACVPTHASATEQVFLGGENYHGHMEVPGMLPPESIYEGPDVVQGTSSIPTAYDSRDYGNVTAIKDQNPYGTCWSFATMAVMESSLLSQGIYEDVDLSEYHLIYYSFNGVTDDPLGGTSNDSITYSHDMATALETGGNATVAYHALANWVGAVEEDMVPYPTVTGSVESLPGTTESAYLNNVVHLQQAYIMNKSDTAAIKQFIMDYGAVTASFFYNANFLNDDAYYTNHYTGSNHAITLVGWDDNYSKNNFRTQPSKNGAWLVKNSWDTWFGDGGYFWLSYEDTSLQDTFCAFVAESADNYDNNYQYDGSYLNSNYTFTEAKVANVFQAKAGTWGETLDAVAFETTSVNLNYSVQIYTDLTDATDPTSGKERLSQPVTGTTTFQGYYTVELPQSVLLQPGQTFSVVISLDKGGEEFRVPVETDFTWNLGLGDYITYTANAEANQSFIEYDNYGYWWDVGAANGTNVRVKAFTTNMAPPVAVEGVTISPRTPAFYVGGTKQLTATVSPADASNKGVTWSSSNPSVASVDQNGLVTGLKFGSANITATTVDGGYTDTVKVSIMNYPVSTVTVTPESAEIYVGETTQLTASVLPEEATIQSVSWSSSDTTVATVNENGLVTAKKQGTAVITATSDSDVTIADTATIRVKNMPVAGVSVTPYLAEVVLGGDVQLTAVISPANATNKAVSWSSSDPSVATVDASGKVSTKKAGSAEITCTTEDGAYTATTTVQVLPISLTADVQKLLVDSGLQLRIKINEVYQPISVNTDYDWTVEPAGVVEVSENGMLNGLGVGTATVTCTHKDYPVRTASFEVEIEIPFADIKLTDWQYPYVVYAYKNNLMSGKKEHVFDMNGKLTRAEFVTVLYSYSGKPEVTYEQYFSDVEEGKWFADAIIWAKQNNVTAGNPDGTFGVNNNINREQLVVMLYGYAKNKGLVTGQVQTDLSAYSDLDKVSTWAREAFSWAVQNGIVSGKTNKVDNTPILDPKGNASRGECATIMKGFVESTK